MVAGTITIERLLELLLQQIEVNRRLTVRVEMLETRYAAKPAARTRPRAKPFAKA
jgi:hypothetical protein